MADGSPEHVLQAELRNTERYAAILQAIATGCTRMGEIIGRIPDLSSATDVSYYLSRLQQLHLIRRNSSLDRRDRPKERNAFYFIEDPLIAFWHRFVLPNASALQAGYAEEVYDKVIAPGMDEFMGEAFERICRAHMSVHGPDVVGEPAREVGKIWGSDFDIDVAGQTLSKHPFFGECKWWSSLVGNNVLNHLRETIGKATYGQGSGGHREILFSRSGFTPELRELAKKDRTIALVDLADLLGERN